MPTKTAPTADLDLAKLRNLAVRGQEAAAELAAVELSRQEARTAELAAQQSAYDADLCRRGPEVDADLDRQRDDALAALQSAVDGADLGAALVSWRREAAARYAQREFRQAWRDARTRTGEGPVPPPPSERDAERDELAGFVPAVARAVESGARLDADGLAVTLVGERPYALPGEVLPGEAASLLHELGCPDTSRVEVVESPVGRYSAGRVARCMSCGASAVLHLPPVEAEDIEAAAPGAAVMRRPDALNPYGVA